MNDDPISQRVDLSLLGRLLPFARPHLALGVLALVAMGATAALQLVGPLATAVAIDLFIAPGLGGAERSSAAEAVAKALGDSPLLSDPRRGLAAACAVWLASLLLAFATQLGERWALGALGQLTMRDLRREVFSRLQSLPVPFFDRQPVGRLVTRATTDVEALNELFTSGLVAIVGDLAVLAGIVVVLFWLDWRLALVAFAILPFLGALTMWFKTRARAAQRDVRGWIARVSSFLQEHLAGMTVVQLFGQERRTLERFDQPNLAHRDANVRAIRYYAIYYPAVELITACGLALLLWRGGIGIAAGVLSIGALTAFLQYAQRFYQPLADLAERYTVVQSALASAERIVALLDEPLQIASPPRPHRAPVEGRITFDQVSFSYLPGEPVLQAIQLEVKLGETLAVVGHTGAGKSTLANLIVRFYDVDQGRILVDGVDVKQWDLELLRRSVASVQQEVVLFSGSIADNVRLGCPELDDDGVRRALAEAQALDLVERMPEGIHTPIRERGGGLSSGERQLIAFARAIAVDPRILVLDEATAAVDSATEERLQRALERLLVGRTAIVIAHRLATVRRADRIVVLHHGRVREIGTHDELLAQGGLYATLVRLQFGAADPG